MSKWFACGVIHLAKSVLGELGGNFEEKKERKKERKKEKKRERKKEKKKKESKGVGLHFKR